MASEDSSLAGKAAVKMATRFKALLRKARPELVKGGMAEPAVAEAGDAVVAALCKHVQRKRDYEELFDSEENAESWALKHSLSEPQKEVLLAMQKAKDIFIPNPWLDHAFTAFFFAEILFVLYDMTGRGYLYAFLGILLLVHLVINRVKVVSATVGTSLSQWLFKKGFVDATCHPLAGPIQLKKWTEQSWQLFVHVTAAATEFLILCTVVWWEEPNRCFIPRPDEQPPAPIALQGLYIAQLCVWIYTCVIHRFFDERRRDYFMMYLHHLITIALVGMSWYANYLRIGLLVLYVHDASDIYIDLLKMINFLKLEGRRGWYASEGIYIASVGAWLYYRMYQYPFRVIPGSFIAPYLEYGPSFPSWRDWSPSSLWNWLAACHAMLPRWLESNILLCALLVLHVIWLYILLRVGYRILTESAREASRQEYEGDSDDEDATAAVTDAATGGAAAVATGVATGAAKANLRKRN